jgi:hypothetical protein
MQAGLKGVFDCIEAFSETDFTDALNVEVEHLGLVCPERILELHERARELFERLACILRRKDDGDPRPALGMRRPSSILT